MYACVNFNANNGVARGVVHRSVCTHAYACGCDLHAFMRECGRVYVRVGAYIQSYIHVSMCLCMCAHKRVCLPPGA